MSNRGQEARPPPLPRHFPCHHNVEFDRAHVEVEVLNPETGEIMERGKQGELCCRGYNAMQFFKDGQIQQDQSIGIIDFMGDAGNQYPKGRHFIGLNQLLLVLAQRLQGVGQRFCSLPHLFLQ